MPRFLDFFWFEFYKSVTLFYMISLFYKKFKTFSIHIYCIYTYMYQQLHSIGQCQSTCMPRLSHNYTDFCICRRRYDRILWFECNTVSHNFL